MPIIMLILSALGAALWFWVRNNPRDAIHVAQDAATTLRNAPRKFAFRKQSNAHPVEGIDDPWIAICAIGQAFIELDELPTKEQRNRLHIKLRARLRCTDDEAQELQVLGRWLVTQCDGPKPAMTRLGRRLYKMEGDAMWDTLQEFLGALVTEDLSPDQLDAIADLKRAMHQH